MSKAKDKPAKPEAEAPAEGEAPVKKKMSGKTLVLFIVLPAVLVLGGGGAAVMMLTGGKPETEVADASHGEAADAHGEKPAKGDKAKAKDDHGKASKDAGKDSHGAAAGGDPEEVGTLRVGEDGAPSYYEMPNLLVNLSSSDGGRPLFLKLKLVLEARDPAAFATLPGIMPRVSDQFQGFLRELRVDDLNGSAGSHRLRIELLRRVNLAVAPASVDAVLIEELLVQ
ncbi:flagellar basal body-associated protein FliL [bacterium]|nr:flagellar basal body-associated protein FliL [bacterium]